MDYFEQCAAGGRDDEYPMSEEAARPVSYEFAYEALTSAPHEYEGYFGYGVYGPMEAEPVACEAFAVEPYRGSRLRSPSLGRPLKIVCLGPSFELGGVGQQTLSLARYFDPQRARIIRCLVTRGEAKGHRQLQQIGIPVARVTPERLEQASQEADVLLLWGDHFDRGLPAKRPLCVYVAHGESAWTRQGLERSRGVVDHVIAVSERVRRLVCRGFPATTILNGIDTKRLAATQPRQSVRRSLGIRSDDFVVGCVGRMTREKRMELLVEAVAQLPLSYKLLLVGSGPRKTELLQLANDRLPGRFALVSRDEHIGDLYRAMDAFALPSAHEGFGLVVAEAMACRRPVIATCVGAVPEIIVDRVSGLVVNHAAEDFAAAAERLRAYPQWAAGLAAQACDFALRHLNARRMASDYEALLTRLVLANRERQQA
jgi:glycosyltransferase involved in cell wall biosynthesis